MSAGSSFWASLPRAKTKVSGAGAAPSEPPLPPQPMRKNPMLSQPVVSKSRAKAGAGFQIMVFAMNADRSFMARVLVHPLEFVEHIRNRPQALPREKRIYLEDDLLNNPVRTGGAAGNQNTNRPLPPHGFIQKRTLLAS